MKISFYSQHSIVSSKGVHFNEDGKVCIQQVPNTRLCDAPILRTYNNYSVSIDIYIQSAAQLAHLYW